jgi:uncharacterized RDD family membrane protein YckC
MMQNHAPDMRDQITGLPDPHYQAEFYADVPMKRFMAWIMDIMLIAGLTTLAIIFTVGIGLFFAGFIYLVLGFSYRVITLANGSATLGMRLMAIELRSHRGEKLELSQAVLHVLGYYISMSMVIVQIASVILMLTTPRGQGLTDMVLGTVAVNRRARV